MRVSVDHASSHDQWIDPPGPAVTEAWSGNQRTSSLASVRARHTSSGDALIWMEMSMVRDWRWLAVPAALVMVVISVMTSSASADAVAGTRSKAQWTRLTTGEPW